MIIDPLNLADSYKVGHQKMYPKGMTYLQSNWTARSSRVQDVNKVVFFGLQGFIQEVLVAGFSDFFNADSAKEAVAHHKKRVEGLLGMPFDTTHWEKLWELGYLPLKFSALPEGTEVPLRVPMFIVENTHKDFAWLVNYIESIMSNQIWQTMTTATLAVRLRRMLDKWAEKTSDTPEFVDWQGHDFSFRGMSNLHSGAGHLLAFAGTDTLSAMDWLEAFYNATGFIGGSVPATEHSVMCAGGKDDELETFSRLLDENPAGILSVVSDTWDLWKVITEILPKLKDKIVTRNGKLVIRPDSGDPIDIICGTKINGTTPIEKGVIELLWDVFGGTTNSKGYKVLDQHIGAIYGDSITYDRADEICRRLEAKVFASTNIVLGVGSFSYQFVTRDTFGFAMKATACVVNGEERALYKDPVTDSGIKKSAKGKLAVLKDANGEYFLVNEAMSEQIQQSKLKPVWENGFFVTYHTFSNIAKKIGLRKLLPE